MMKVHPAGVEEAGVPTWSSGPHEGARVRNIVAATDLSAGGSHAVAVASALAKRAGVKLSVLSVVELSRGPETRYTPDPAGSEWLDLRQEEVRRSIDRELKAMGAGPALVHVGAGDPPTVVAAFAGKFRSSLVVVGAHRLSSFQRVLAGSTGERIAQYAGCPVLVASGRGTGPFEKILVAVDLTPESPSILAYAGHLAQLEGAELRVVFSEEPSSALWRKVALRNLGSVWREGRRRYEELFASVPLPDRAESVVLFGSAGRAILGEAQRWGANLVVLGIRTHRFLAPGRLGRTARHVLRQGDLSILVVPN